MILRYVKNIIPHIILLALLRNHILCQFRAAQIRKYANPE